jgi:deoxycytidylate deaminase
MENLDTLQMMAGFSENPTIKVAAKIGRYCFNNNGAGHAEENLLNNAIGDWKNETLYVYPCPPCPRCAALIIRHGIKRVVTYSNPDACPPQRPEQQALSAELFMHAGVDHQIVRVKDDREAGKEV